MAEEKAISPASPSKHNESRHPETDTRGPAQLEGWRRIFVLVAVFIGLFLAVLDSTIVSVALATIADDFDDFNNATWVITAYLLAYMAFAIIITRLSDIFGRKAVEVASLVLFIAFSLA